MSRRLRELNGPLSVIGVALMCACAVEGGDDDMLGTGGTGPTTGGTGGSTTGGTGGASTTGGTGGTIGGMGGTLAGSGGSTGAVAGQPGSAGSGVVTGGSSGAGPAAGVGGAAGAPGAGGSAGAAGGSGGAPGGAGGSGGSAAGAGGSPFGGNGGTGGAPPPLDCGPEGWAVENNGPPSNRVNYVILGDGYTSATVDTTLVEHINVMLARRFEHESGEPYGRYRQFVNICVMKAVRP
jgi:hypothetical protein